MNFSEYARTMLKTLMYVQIPLANRIPLDIKKTCMILSKDFRELPPHFKRESSRVVNFLMLIAGRDFKEHEYKLCRNERERFDTVMQATLVKDYPNPEYVHLNECLVEVFIVNGTFTGFARHVGAISIMAYGLNPHFWNQDNYKDAIIDEAVAIVKNRLSPEPPDYNGLERDAEELVAKVPYYTQMATGSQEIPIDA